MLSTIVNTKIRCVKNTLLGAVSNPLPPPGAYPDLPTEATDSQILNYSGLVLNYEQVDTLINALYNDGFCTNCIIDISNNSAPTATSSAALAGLREVTGMNNTVITD